MNRITTILILLPLFIDPRKLISGNIATFLFLNIKALLVCVTNAVLTIISETSLWSRLSVCLSVGLCHNFKFQYPCSYLSTCLSAIHSYQLTLQTIFSNTFGYALVLFRRGGCEKEKQCCGGTAKTSKNILHSKRKLCNTLDWLTTSLSFNTLHNLKKNQSWSLFWVHFF